MILMIESLNGKYIWTRLHILVVAEVKGHSRSFKVIMGHQLYKTKEYAISSQLFNIYKNFKMRNHLVLVLEENHLIILISKFVVSMS